MGELALNCSACGRTARKGSTKRAQVLEAEGTMRGGLVCARCAARGVLLVAAVPLAERQDLDLEAKKHEARPWYNRPELPAAESADVDEREELEREQREVAAAAERSAELDARIDAEDQAELDKLRDEAPARAAAIAARLRDENKPKPRKARA